MPKIAKKIMIFAMIYAVMFWAGFKSGEINARSKRGFTVVERMVGEPNVFYVVEERPGGYTEIYGVDRGNPLIKILSNDKLKYILKFKKVQIYDTEGVRLY